MDLEIREYQNTWEAEIVSKLEAQFAGKLTVTKTETRRIEANVDRAAYKAICQFIHDELSFEHCAIVMGNDCGDAEQKMEVITILDNYTCYKGMVIALTAAIPYDDLHIETVSDIWGGANWHERETWELFGIVFDNHPRLERLLTPDNYEFFPFRKSYKLRGQQ